MQLPVIRVERFGFEVQTRYQTAMVRKSRLAADPTAVAVGPDGVMARLGIAPACSCSHGIDCDRAHDGRLDPVTRTGTDTGATHR